MFQRLYFMLLFTYCSKHLTICSTKQYYSTSLVIGLVMDKYYVLNINPQAAQEWDRCVLRNPMTGARPDLNEEVARVVNDRKGAYLIKVRLEIEILEEQLAPPSKTVELSPGKQKTISQRLAS